VISYISWDLMIPVVRLITFLAKPETETEPVFTLYNALVAPCRAKITLPALSKSSRAHQLGKPGLLFAPNLTDVHRKPCKLTQA
jgi:hypothetical protein